MLNFTVKTLIPESAPWLGAPTARRTFLPLCMSLAFALFCWIFAAPALAAEKTKSDTVLIFDASRSMWGQIEGVHRYQMAQGVITNQLRARRKHRNLGLIAFGHRTASNCGDIETLLGPNQFDTEGYISALETIKPKGKTPIATSLESAVNELSAAHRAQNIILLTDGLDNCKADPCATAARLKALNPGLKIHTIAFAVEEEQHGFLRCVSSETEGRFFHANTEIELSIAFKEALEISEKASLTRPVARSKKLKKAKGDATRTASIRIPDPRAGWAHIAMNGIDPSLRLNRASSANGRSGMKLRARMADNIPAISRKIKWTVYKYDVVRKTIGEKVATENAASPAFTLPEGEYVVRLAYDHITASNVVSVRDKEISDATFVLNAGGLSVDAKLAFLEAPRGQVAKQWLYGKLKDKHGRPQAYAKITTPGHTIRLNAGTYKLVSLFGAANSVVETEVTIKPGLLTEVEINHKAGIVSLKLSKNNSRQLNWKIRDASNKLVTTRQDPARAYILAPGKYTAETKYEGKHFRTQFEIKEGESKQIVVSDS